MNRVRPKKKFGQHFLINKDIAQRITDLLNKESKHVLEIGPGMGILTQFLAKKRINLQLIEIDQESITYIQKNYPRIRDRIILYDFLKFNIKDYYKENLSIIGNFPYNISSQILFKVLRNKDIIIEVIGMFQKEVAQRICAKEGKNKGILTILVQAFYNVEYCFNVEKEYFNPIPNVESAIIKLTRNKIKNIDCSEDLFFEVVKKGYNQRRKTLRNALKSFSLKDNLRMKSLLDLRAEQLSVEDFITITNNVQQ